MQSESQILNVLVVEDDPQIGELQRKLLERAGFAVKLANTGPDGLRLARTEVPHAVVMDGDLPGMDGFETCRRLKSEARTCHIPVLFCSGSHNALELAHAAGADDFLAKPCEVMQLPERVVRLLKI